MLLKILYFILAALLFSSCAVRSVYVPASQNVILFNSNKQIQATGYLGINTYQLQMAFNPLNHFVIGANNSYGSGLTIYEAFAGLYNYSKNDATWRYEVLGGGGYTNNYSQVVHGTFAALQHRNSNFETVSVYSKAFVQPSFGFFSKINIYKLSYSFSFGNRFSFIHFDKYIYREIDVDNTPNNGPNVYVVNKEYHNRNLFLLEPCITNKVSRKNISAVLQLMAMMPYSTQIDIRYTKFSPVFLFSLGLQYNFVFKKQKPVEKK